MSATLKLIVSLSSIEACRRKAREGAILKKIEILEVFLAESIEMALKDSIRTPFHFQS